MSGMDSDLVPVITINAVIRDRDGKIKETIFVDENGYEVVERPQ